MENPFTAVYQFMILTTTTAIEINMIMIKENSNTPFFNNNFLYFVHSTCLSDIF